MESVRQKQVAEMIRRQFSYVLAEEGRYVYGSKPLVTITSIKMAPDLALAKVYLSIYNHENKQEIITLLEENYPRIKQAFYSKIKKQLRIMPELKFYIDDTLDEVYRIDSVFKKLRSEHQMGEEE